MRTYIVFDDSDLDNIELLDPSFLPDVGDEITIKDKELTKKIVMVTKVEKILIKEGKNADVVVNIHVKSIKIYAD